MADTALTSEDQVVVAATKLVKYAKMIILQETVSFRLPNVRCNAQSSMFSENQIRGIISQNHRRGGMSPGDIPKLQLRADSSRLAIVKLDRLRTHDNVFPGSNVLSPRLVGI